MRLYFDRHVCWKLIDILVTFDKRFVFFFFVIKGDGFINRRFFYIISFKNKYRHNIAHNTELQNTLPFRKSRLVFYARFFALKRVRVTQFVEMEFRWNYEMSFKDFYLSYVTRFERKFEIPCNYIKLYIWSESVAVWRKCRYQ